MKVAAPILLVTGWNEWTASVWETPGVPMLGRVTQKGQGHIVDEFNEEFDRDLEPMRGGYGDAYYCQFVANMRRYKGMSRPPASVRPEDDPPGRPAVAVGWGSARLPGRGRGHGEPGLGRGGPEHALHRHQRPQRHHVRPGRARPTRCSTSMSARRRV